MNLAFHSNQIGLLGTEISLFNYADYCERLFGHKIIVISKENKVKERSGANINHYQAIAKFRSRFPLYLYKEISEIEGILTENRIDLFYAQKRGDADGVISDKVRTVVHAVFKYHEPHGAVYAYCHQWLSDIMTAGAAPVVPYMVDLPKQAGDLRGILGIPKDALVVGRYGGVDSFDLKFVHELIVELVREHNNIYFLFMNTSNFVLGDNRFLAALKAEFMTENKKRILFLPPTTSLKYKSEFINTCDAMLHARRRGETFGAAIAEFSSHNKPIITYSGDGSPRFEGSHLQMLGEKGFYYNNHSELRYILKHFIQNREAIIKENWDTYSVQFAPLTVMEQFKRIFLD